MSARSGSDGSAAASRSPSALLGAAVAEAIGTYIFVFLGTGAVVAIGSTAAKVGINGPAALSILGLAAIGIAFGFAVLVSVYAFGHVSGAHVNPAVTIALAAVRRFPLSAVPVYLAAQFAGALAASATVYAVFPDSAADPPLVLGATVPMVGDGLALLAEVVLAFLLLVTILATATDDRATPPAVGLAVGLVVGAGVIAMLPISGASFNPARALAPMIVATTFKGWWIYIVGPIVGAVLGAVVYDYVIRPGSPPAMSGTVEEQPKESGAR